MQNLSCIFMTCFNGFKIEISTQFGAMREQQMRQRVEKRQRVQCLLTNLPGQIHNNFELSFLLQFFPRISLSLTSCLLLHVAAVSSLFECYKTVMWVRICTIYIPPRLDLCVGSADAVVDLAHALGSASRDVARKTLEVESQFDFFL